MKTLLLTMILATTLTGSSIYDFKVAGLDGNDIDFSQYKGKKIMIVNTASKCGNTPQYAELEKLYEKYKERGFVILGFPCNQFNKQEPGTEAEIASFCKLNYGVTFPLFKKIDVNGKNTEPLYNFLKRQAKGIFGSKKIKWNFTKFLIDRNGKVIKRFSPYKSPLKFEAEILKFLENY